jgi:hypothetical protein
VDAADFPVAFISITRNSSGGWTHEGGNSGRTPNAAEGARLPELVRVRGAREHNLKERGRRHPRDARVVFTGVSGSGQSSLAFGTLYAEEQRRYPGVGGAVRAAPVSPDGPPMSTRSKELRRTPPALGEEGGHVVVAGPPAGVAQSRRPHHARSGAG